MKLRLQIFTTLSFIMFFCLNIFSQENNGVEVKSNEKGLKAIFKDGSQTTPYMFNNLTKINDTIFIFSITVKLSGEIEKCISKMLSEKEIQKKIDNYKSKNTEEEDYSNYNFNGIINNKGKVLGGEKFRSIEHIDNTTFFRVQTLLELENDLYSLVDFSGKEFTKYEYIMLWCADDKIFGTIENEKGHNVIEFDLNGNVVEK